MTVETFAEVPRDRFGRPLLIPPHGGKPIPYTRCTTSIRRADDTYIHADCDEQPTPDPIEGPACSVCWLRHPTGECDRD